MKSPKYQLKEALIEQESKSEILRSQLQRHLLVCYTMLHLLQLPLNNHDKRSHVTGCGFKEQRAPSLLTRSTCIVLKYYTKSQLCISVSRKRLHIVHKHQYIKMWVIQLQCHRGRVSSICSDSSAPTDSVSVSAEPLVPIEPLLLECDKVSSCRLSLNPSATSDIVGRSFPAFSVQRRANSATVHRELTSQFPFILGSVTFSISPSESLPCTQCARLVLSVLFTVMIAGRPVMSTKRTTPKLKTSLFSLK